MSTTVTQHQSRMVRSVPAGFIGLIGAILGALAIGFLLTHRESAVWWQAELIVVAAVSVAIVFGAYRLAGSSYDTTDLWVILAWSVAGIVGADLIGGGLYLHQLTERVNLADPAFFFEYLSLLGLAIGLAFGISRRSRIRRELESVFDEEPVDPDAIRTLLTLLGGDGRTLRRRWDVAAAIAETTTLALPIPALAHRLAVEEMGVFPDDETDVETLLYEEILPTLAENGVVDVDYDTETVEYVGPEAAVDHLATPS